MKDSTLRSQLYASLILDPKAFEAAKRLEQHWEEMEDRSKAGDPIGYAKAREDFLRVAK